MHGDSYMEGVFILTPACEKHSVLCITLYGVSYRLCLCARVCVCVLACVFGTALRVRTVPQALGSDAAWEAYDELYFSEVRRHCSTGVYPT